MFRGLYLPSHIPLLLKLFLEDPHRTCSPKTDLANYFGRVLIVQYNVFLAHEATSNLARLGMVYTGVAQLSHDRSVWLKTGRMTSIFKPWVTI